MELHIMDSCSTPGLLPGDYSNAEPCRRLGSNQLTEVAIRQPSGAVGLSPDAQRSDLRKQGMKQLGIFLRSGEHWSWSVVKVL